MNTQTETLLQHMDEEWQEDWNGQAIRAELRRLDALNAELLEALKEAVEYLDVPPFTNSTASMCRAAIAKAEGQA